MLKRGISSVESVFLEEYIMKQVNCPICNCKCIKHGKIKSGSQRWFCKCLSQGDAVVWGELHHSSNYSVYWD